MIRLGLVVQHGANRYLVEEEGAPPGRPTWACTLRGRLRKGRREGVRPAVIGDRVRFDGDLEGENRQGVIEEILPRRNQISRPAPSGGNRRPLEQVVMANLDRLWVTVSLVEPPLNLRFVDRILAAARHQGVQAGIVLNKSDLGGPDPMPIQRLYEDLGYPVRICSARTGRGLAELAQELSGKISAFVGLSGVGKSSLLGALQPGLELRVQTVGEKSGHGRHTTSGSRLYRLDQLPGPAGSGASPQWAYLADTPGMREFGLWDMSRDELADGFVEIEARAGDCRFRDCLHVVEPSCAVRAAVEVGEVDRRRYDSYVALLQELGPEAENG